MLSIDVKRVGNSWEPYTRGGRDATGLDAAEWAAEAVSRGAGEILLTSIDRDGTCTGFDCELTATIASIVPVPVIASGGARCFDDFVAVFQARGRGVRRAGGLDLSHARHIRSRRSKIFLQRKPSAGPTATKSPQ